MSECTLINSAVSSRRLFDMMRGPQTSDEGVTGCWNLYTYRGLEPDGSLDKSTNTDKASLNWIWNEGIPADIPVLNGHRVILLGPASYQRSWTPQRDFNLLQADLTISKKLSAGEVKEWLEQIAAANLAI